jgi:hypothetical protein
VSNSYSESEEESSESESWYTRDWEEIAGLLEAYDCDCE